MQGDVRFAVLGPVRAWRGEAELDVGHPKQRAALLVHAGAQVPLEQLSPREPRHEYRSERDQERLNSMRIQADTWHLGMSDTKFPISARFGACWGVTRAQAFASAGRSAFRAFSSFRCWARWGLVSLLSG
jgi:hypothetical protein